MRIASVCYSFIHLFCASCTQKSTTTNEQQQKKRRNKINKMMKCCSWQLLSPDGIYLMFKVTPSEKVMKIHTHKSTHKQQRKTSQQ